MKIFHSAHSPDDIDAKLARLEELERDFAGAVERAKMAAVKEFAYGAGHEINNPLANISARAQTLLREEPNHDKRHKLATIIAQAQRAHEMITDLMLFAKPPKLKLESVNLRAWISTILADLRVTAEAKGVSLLENFPTDETLKEIFIYIDPIQLAVAVRAIVTNAVEVLPSGGEIQVELIDALDSEAKTIDPNPSPTEIGIAISDNGPGMPAETRERIFDPFFSGREAGRGLGFGLCKAWRTIDEHQGYIFVRSEVGVGSTFVLWLKR